MTSLTARSLMFMTEEERTALRRGLGFRVWGLGFGVWGLGFAHWQHACASRVTRACAAGSFSMRGSGSKQNVKLKERPEVKGGCVHLIVFVGVMGLFVFVFLQLFLFCCNCFCFVAIVFCFCNRICSCNRFVSAISRPIAPAPGARPRRRRRQQAVSVQKRARNSNNHKLLRNSNNQKVTKTAAKFI